MFFCRHVFISLGSLPRYEITWSCNKCMLNFIRKCQAVFQGRCTILRIVLYYALYYIIPAATMYESSSCPTSLSTVDIISLLNFSYFSACAVIFHCGLNLHLLMASDTRHLFMCLWPLIYFLL